MGSKDVILEENTQRLFGPNLVSFHPVVLNNIFLKDFHFFNKSEMMAAISDLGQGHRTQL